MPGRRYARTEKGHAEIAERRKNLRGKLRAVLFLIDPGKTPEDIDRQLVQLGAPVDALAQLLAEGYIAEVGAALPGGTVALPTSPDELDRFRVAKAYMNETIVDVLGIRAFMLTLKLEKCATRTDLAALVDDFAAALAKKLPPAEVKVLVERVGELLRAQ